MSGKLARGEIVYYNDAEGKNFGFIRPDDDHESAGVFFHNTRQRTYLCDGGDIPAVDGWYKPAYKGARVVFEAEDSRKGKRAKTWAFEDNYDAAIAAIAARPVVRLRSRQGQIPKSSLWERPVYRVLWQGKDIRQLRCRFPKSSWPLVDHHDHGLTMERYNEETQGWEPYEDPR